MKNKKMKEKYQRASAIAKLTPEQKRLFDEENARMESMKPLQKVLYKKFFQKLPPEIDIDLILAKEKLKEKKKLPWFIDIVFFLLSSAYLTFCIFYVVSFAVTKGPKVANAWLISLLVANGQSIFVSEPINSLFLFVILPSITLAVLSRSTISFDNSATIARRRWKLLAENIRMHGKGRSSSRFATVVEIYMLHVKLKGGQDFEISPEDQAWAVIGLASIVKRMKYDKHLTRVQSHIRR